MRTMGLALLMLVQFQPLAMGGGGDTKLTTTTSPGRALRIGHSTRTLDMLPGKNVPAET